MWKIISQIYDKNDAISVQIFSFCCNCFAPTFLLIELGYLNLSDGEYIILLAAFCVLFGFRVIFYQDYLLRPYWLFRPSTLSDKVKLFLALSGYLLLFELLITFIRIINLQRSYS